MSLVGKIADLLTEQLLASVVPDIVELGTREFRRLNGIFREGKFHLNDRVSVSAPNTVVFSPALVTSIFDPDAFKEALEKLFDGWTKRQKYIALVLPDSLFHIGFLSLSAVLLKGPIQQIVEREVQAGAPMPLAAYKVNYEIGMGKGPKKELLFTCMAHQVITELHDFFEERNIIPLSIHPSFANLIGLVKLIEGDASPHPSVLIHVGNETTTIAIVLGGHIRRIQVLPIGGVLFPMALAKNGIVALKEAETFMRKEVILLDEPSSDAQAEIEAYRPLEPIFCDLLQKIYGLLQLHSSEFPQEGSFRRIILSGGGANLRNLDRLIVANLGLPVAKIGTLLQGFWGNNPLDDDSTSSLAPLLGGICLQPWQMKRFDRMVA